MKQVYSCTNVYCNYEEDHNSNYIDVKRCPKCESYMEHSFIIEVKEFKIVVSKKGE
jgi:hypothetical protein